MMIYVIGYMWENIHELGFIFMWLHIPIYLVQMFFGYGTAFRLTLVGKRDNGIALCGWLILMDLAAFVPGLGLYLWFRHKNIDDDSHLGTTLEKCSATAGTEVVSKAGVCPKCGELSHTRICVICGTTVIL